MLPEQGEVGLVSLMGQERQFRKLTIEMSETQRISLRADDFGTDGPDIGFLRLPDKCLPWLRAINSFYNLTKSAADFLGNRAPGPDFVDAVVGMIAERTMSITEDNLRNPTVGSSNAPPRPGRQPSRTGQMNGELPAVIVYPSGEGRLALIE